MNPAFNPRIARKHFSTRIIMALFLAGGALGAIFTPLGPVWAADDCAQRFREQLLQEAWKQSSTVAAYSPSATASAGSAGSVWEHAVREALLQVFLTDADRDVIIEAYQNHRWEPLFVNSGFQLTSSGNQLLSRLEDVAADGIDPKPYQLEQLRSAVKVLDELRQGKTGTLKTSIDEMVQHAQTKNSQAGPVSSCDPADVRRLLDTAPASSDASIRKAALECQSAIRTWYGKLASQASLVDIYLASGLVQFARDMQRFSNDRLLMGMTEKLPMSDLLKSMEPASPHYQALRRAYGVYAKLAQRNQPKTIHATASIRAGTRSPVIRTLQERLHEEGYYSGEFSGVYDHATVEAVKRFQVQHLQDGDGVLGKKTVEWLNVSYDKKARMIAQSLEALRKSESRQYERFVWINIPQFVMQYVKNGKVEATHRVIVGKSSGKRVKIMGRTMGENHTPTLVSSIQQVVFNPRWYVSDRISLELGAGADGDPGYFERLGMVRMSSHYPWGSPRLYQPPGPGNPLGRVKFEFPNVYAVYLHDTPKKHLFQRTRRDFSHGCMRLEGALDFARLLLRDDANPTADKIDSYLRNYQSRHVSLNNPVPIVVEYATVSTNGNGEVVFCGDVYGWLQNLS